MEDGYSSTPVANTATGAPADNVTPSTQSPAPQQSTAESLNVISNGDLPWAVVVLGPESAGQSGVGWNRHSLQPETWVFGVFADGDDCQQPLVLGVIPGGPGGGTGFGGSDGEGGGSGGGTGGDGSSPGSDPGTGGTGTGIDKTPGDTTEKIARYLISKGYTTEQAAGILGNLSVESGFRPGVDVRDSNNLMSKGIAQWNGPRREALARFARARGQDWNSLETQLNFLTHELDEGKDAMNAKALVKAAKSPRDAAVGFIVFERPQGAFDKRLRRGGGSGVVVSHSTVQARIKKANEIYNRLTSKGITNTNPLNTGGR